MWVLSYDHINCIPLKISIVHHEARQLMVNSSKHSNYIAPKRQLWAASISDFCTSTFRLLWKKFCLSFTFKLCRYCQSWQFHVSTLKRALADMALVLLESIWFEFCPGWNKSR
ncbi:hypothetical protein CLIB1444_18S00166 [[Candida] jaroonii]|uniref:Uncharacterized protein n=1 Tax=[Candida] jaroonii TaxID=467808 RepID=A0ACA9YEY6_9ASCO|nr:hypothetical protein CLIB1444_18S00166 [[Candida] jaroonii]